MSQRELAQVPALETGCGQRRSRRRPTTTFRDLHRIVSEAAFVSSLSAMSAATQSALPEEADAAKSLGSAAFSAGLYQDALEHYTSALGFAPDAAVLYSNRSVTYLKLDRTTEALQDAKRSTELAPSWARAWQRLAQSEEVRGRIFLSALALLML